jgi:aminoglycoside phosphotransferase (APT) family kinase protein
MDSETVAAALLRLAPQLAPGGQTVDPVARLSTGASLETWAFDVRGETGATKLILRRRDGRIGRPSTFTSSVGLGTEAALLAAAERGGVPVAHLVRACEPADGLGEALIVARIDGETRGRRIVAAARAAGTGRELAAQCGAILARIHAVPAEPAMGLAVSDARGELERYEAIYRQIGGARPILELGFQALRRRAPACPNPVLVHGDFRNGNLMVGPDGRIAAVLDWELSHRGDPAEDLGWLCVNSWRFGAADKPVGGFGDDADLLDAYEAESGRRVDPARVRYWEAVGSLKWAVMCLMMVAAHRAGEGASLERLMIGRRASEAELDLIGLLEGLT